MLAIIGAMDEEIELLLADLQGREDLSFPGVTLHRGVLDGVSVPAHARRHRQGQRGHDHHAVAERRGHAGDLYRRGRRRSPGAAGGRPCGEHRLRAARRGRRRPWATRWARYPARPPPGPPTRSCGPPRSPLPRPYRTCGWWRAGSPAAISSSPRPRGPRGCWRPSGPPAPRWRAPPWRRCVPRRGCPPWSSAASAIRPTAAPRWTTASSCPGSPATPETVVRGHARAAFHRPVTAAPSITASLPAPVRFVLGLGILVGFAAAGQALVTVMHLPLPGSVVGWRCCGPRWGCAWFGCTGSRTRPTACWASWAAVRAGHGGLYRVSVRRGGVGPVAARDDGRAARGQRGGRTARLAAAAAWSLRTWAGSP